MAERKRRGGSNPPGRPKGKSRNPKRCLTLNGTYRFIICSTRNSRLGKQCQHDFAGNRYRLRGSGSTGNPKGAGADVKEERVRFPKGMCQSLIRDTAPKEFIQHARNRKKCSYRRGEPDSVPAYGSPFIRNVEEGRRYATIEDFAILSSPPTQSRLHHSGGTICGRLICR